MHWMTDDSLVTSCLQVDLLDSPIARLPDIDTTTLGATYVSSLDAGVWTKEQLFAG
jgi:glycerol kinase